MCFFQDYMVGLDPVTSSQVITLITIATGITHYFMPHRSAKKLGIRKETPLIVWFIERIGLINCEMGLAMFCLFFLGMDGKDAIATSFLLWGLDSIRTIFRVVPQIPGVNQILHQRGHNIDLLIIICALLGWYHNKAWYGPAMVANFCWMLFNGATFLTLPGRAWTEWGVSYKNKKQMAALGRMHAGSYVEWTLFGTLIFHGHAPRRALGYALFVKLFQIMISHLLFPDEKVLHMSVQVSSFWIFVYVPIIGSLLL